MLDKASMHSLVDSRESSIIAMILTMKTDALTQDQIISMCAMNGSLLSHSDQIHQAIKNMSLANGKLACAVLDYIDTQQEIRKLVEDVI